MTRTGVLLALSLFVLGCGGGAANGFDEEGIIRDTRITIEVVNSSYSEATLHVFRGGERSRLGIVGALDEASFELDWRLSLDLQLSIRLLAGPSCLTRPIGVDPGDILDVSIQNNLRQDLDCISAPG
ncbi:MAG: hypothetical protein ACR2QM_05250 [Longimicrobiales bacterium]